MYPWLMQRMGIGSTTHVGSWLSFCLSWSLVDSTALVAFNMGVEQHSRIFQELLSEIRVPQSETTGLGFMSFDRLLFFMC